MATLSLLARTVLVVVVSGTEDKIFHRHHVPRTDPWLPLDNHIKDADRRDDNNNMVDVKDDSAARFDTIDKRHGYYWPQEPQFTQKKVSILVVDFRKFVNNFICRFLFKMLLIQFTKILLTDTTWLVFS